MNILLFSNSFLPRVGGKEIVIHQLALALRRLGHDVRVAVPGGWRRLRNLRYPYPVYRLPVGARAVSDEMQMLMLWSLRRRWSWDVMHVHNTYPAGHVAARFRPWCRAATVITPHGHDIQTIPEIGHGLRLDPDKRDKIDAAIRAADVLTAISGNIAAALDAVGTGGVPVLRIPNGIDLGRFDRVSTSRVRETYGIPAEARIVLTVGNYFRRRGFEELVRALPGALRREPRLHLVIAGRDTQVLDPLIRTLGLAAHVTLTGAVPLPAGPDGAAAQDPLAELYNEAALYVSAGMAEGAEGLSLALLDAMAAARPIVATAISGNRDVIRHGHNGLVVPPGDPPALTEAISTVIGEPARAGALASRARAEAESYGWPSVAERYVEAYELARGRRLAARLTRRAAA